VHVQPGLLHGRRLAEKRVAVARRHQHADPAPAQKRVGLDQPRGEGGHLRVAVDLSANRARGLHHHGRSDRIGDQVSRD
jgi:hypothetical protein